MGECGSEHFFRGGDRANTVDVNLDPTIDDRYTLLGDRHRRALLYLLSESRQQIHAVPSLSREIAKLVAEEDLTASAIAVELRHKHLPRLSDMGVVDYDVRNGMVVYRGDERVESLLGPAKEVELRSE